MAVDKYTPPLKVSQTGTTSWCWLSKWPIMRSAEMFGREAIWMGVLGKPAIEKVHHTKANNSNAGH